MNNNVEQDYRLVTDLKEGRYLHLEKAADTDYMLIREITMKFATDSNRTL